MRTAPTCRRIGRSEHVARRGRCITRNEESCMSAKIMNQDTINAGLEVEQRLAQELPSVMPNAAFVVGSATMTSAQVVTQVEQHIANERALIALRAQLAAAEANIKVERAAVKATVKAVKAGATAALGVTSA